MIAGIDYCARCRNRGKQPRPGLKSCADCGEKFKADDLRRREAKRAWARTPKALASARRRDSGYRLQARLDAGRPHRITLSRAIDWAVVQWAAEAGYVPSIIEIMEIVPGISKPGATVVRRRAFGLRPTPELRGTGHPPIPYPVPSEWLAGRQAQ